MKVSDQTCTIIFLTILTFCECKKCKNSLKNKRISTVLNLRFVLINFILHFHFQYGKYCRKSVCSALLGPLDRSFLRIMYFLFNFSNLFIYLFFHFYFQHYNNVISEISNCNLILILNRPRTSTVRLSTSKPIQMSINALRFIVDGS